MNKEIILDKSTDLAATVDFNLAFQQATKVIGGMVEIDDAADLVEMEKIKERANSFLLALDNLTVVKHFEEILPNLTNSFKRKEELEGLQNLLTSFNMAVTIGKKNIAYIMNRMDSLYHEEEDLDEDLETVKERMEAINLFQQIYTQALENMNKATAGISKLLELERKSGGRPWGRMDKGTNKTLQLPAPPEEGKTKEIVPSRSLTEEEVSNYETS